MQKNGVFECGFTSFLGQNRTQFSISFFIFALLFLLFDLEILLVYPYLVSAYINEIYGLTILLLFLLALTLGFVFELGKKALTIDSRQTNHNEKKGVSNDEREAHSDVSHAYNLVIIQSSFMNYKIFNRDFWRVYLVTLKTKFTVKHIVFTLLTIILVYCFRNYLQFLLDADLAKFFHYTFIMMASSILFKAILHLLEFMYNASEMAKIPMGTDNTVHVITPKKISNIGNTFAMDGINEKNNPIENNGSNITNNAESNNAVANNTVPSETNNAETNNAVANNTVPSEANNAGTSKLTKDETYRSERAQKLVQKYNQLRGPNADALTEDQTEELHKAAIKAMKEIELDPELNSKSKPRLERLEEKSKRLDEINNAYMKRAEDANTNRRGLKREEQTIPDSIPDSALTRQQIKTRDEFRRETLQPFADYVTSLKRRANMILRMKECVERERCTHLEELEKKDRGKRKITEITQWLEQVQEQTGEKENEEKRKKT